jgi:hypothetical protein
MLTVCWDDPNFVSTLLVTIFQKCQSADNPIYSVNLRDYTLAIAAAFSLAEVWVPFFLLFFWLYQKKIKKESKPTARKRASPHN